MRRGRNAFGARRRRRRRRVFHRQHLQHGGHLRPKPLKLRPRRFAARGDFRPNETDVAFQRVHVPAGSAEEVALTVTPMDFIQVDTAGDSFSVPGTYQVLLTNGNDQTDAMVMATVKITGTKRTVATFD